MAGPLMLDIEGTSLNADEKILLGEPEVGGLILFARNYQNRDQLALLVAEIRSCQPDILIAVDQEGGRVQRFKEGFQRLPPLQKIGELTSQQPDLLEDIASTLGWLMAAEILTTGVDFSFAPVLDLDRDHCAVIADRSFSDNPERCISLAKPYIDGMHAAGMPATAKHFPGHGSVRGDSHLELPVDTREMAEIEQHDLVPFMILAHQYDAVMPGHLLFPKIHDQPVGFSQFWLQEILRGKLGFQGVIFSDDLSMEGAASSGSYCDRAELALNAGCDMVLACNNPAGAREVLEWMKSNALSTSAHLESTTRLDKMRSRAQWDLNTMHADPRYGRALNYLDQISRLG